MLGYSYGYLCYALQNGRMPADAYKTLCNLLGADESILTVDDEKSMYHTGIKIANSPSTTVKIKSTVLKKYLRKIKMSMEVLSTKMGYTYNYVTVCTQSGKMNKDSYEKMCEILHVGKSKFINYGYTDKSKHNTVDIEKPDVKKVNEETKNPKSTEIKPAEIKRIKYSQLVMTDADGTSHVKILIDKDEFDELNTQLSNFLNLMDSAFSQISQLQLKLNELTSKNS